MCCLARSLSRYFRSQISIESEEKSALTICFLCRRVTGGKFIITTVNRGYVTETFVAYMQVSSDLLVCRDLMIHETKYRGYAN